MAAKRFLESSNNDEHTEKKARNNLSFASCVREVWNAHTTRSLSLVLEPMMRRVVQEEIHAALNRPKFPIMKSPSIKLQEIRTLKLIFNNKLTLPIFTGNKLFDIDGNSMQITLISSTGDYISPATGIPSCLKVEIMAINGDFPVNDAKSWTSEEFENGIVKERKGKRPLLAGDSLIITLRDGTATLGDIEFTDNSSWIRSRRFRLGARVIPGSASHCSAVGEAISESFVVKDHRGELYKKHYPPSLNDHVWRLEKIGKDGPFHKKLTENNILNVQDFLKLSTIDSQKLRKILGIGMSEKMWEVTMKHAKTCDLGNKHYILKNFDCTATFNPICQIVNANINGRMCSTEELSSSYLQSQVSKLVKDAYDNWEGLEEVTVGGGNEMIQVLPRIAYYEDHNVMTSGVSQNGFLTFDLEDENMQLTTAYQPSSFYTTAWSPHNHDGMMNSSHCSN